MDFFFGGQEGGKTDFVEIQLRGVERTVVIDELVLLAGRELAFATRGTSMRLANRLEVQGGFNEQNLVVNVKLQRFFFECHFYCPVLSSTTGSGDARSLAKPEPILRGTGGRQVNALAGTAWGLRVCPDGRIIEMQLYAVGARRTHLGNALPSFDLLTLPNQQPAVVAVGAHIGIVVLDDHKFAVTP
ncbi:hypothetical protein SSTU70S_00546 [Stutzerimonas stutzeri]